MHHAAVVWVVAARHSNFIAVINAWHTGRGHQEGHQHFQVVVTCGVAVLNVARPAGQLCIFRKLNRPVGIRNEARSILIACDVTHEVMTAVVRHAFIQHALQVAEVGFRLRKGIHCRIV